MERPNDCKYPYCTECVYVDCIYDGVYSEEVSRQDEFDRDLEAVDPSVLKRRKRQKKYNTTDKGKERQKRYNSTEKAREARKRYRQSEKGKLAERRKAEKRKLKRKTA